MKPICFESAPEPPECPQEPRPLAARYDWRKTLAKALRGAFLGLALAYTYSAHCDALMGRYVAAEYRVVAVATGLPALRNWLKSYLGLGLGGLL